ncbi:polymorphic toxin-type HINT domain-containing protein [Hoylesella pleuritidis]|uniref:polymorphic toxin-type HINT domain-containing protein n=1 Tax=Hoylesella pleuritidis TaxID=407975 RepID=UPI001F5A292E|nr:polymorphic toxin-type HINT domain-containing protein [Hoylesella pleuritidis]
MPYCQQASFPYRKRLERCADLQTGDRIKSRNKEDVEIKDVKFSYKPRKVYNFEVSNWHTYFVRVLAWIVHNAKNVFPEL